VEAANTLFLGVKMECRKLPTMVQIRIIVIMLRITSTISVPDVITVGTLSMTRIMMEPSITCHYHSSFSTLK
jgi:hypothetical protein